MPEGSAVFAEQPVNPEPCLAGLTVPTRRAPATDPELAPLIRQIEEIATRLDEPVVMRVILFDDDVHFFDDVIRIVELATRCPRAKAEAITRRVHEEGEAVAYIGTHQDCCRVGAIFERAALRWQLA